MVVYLTLDSSIIVASLREQEEKHDECKKLLEKTKDGEFIAIEPYTVLVEVVAAIRRTGSKMLAEKVMEYLLKIDTIKFLDFVSVRAEDASEIAKEIGVRGMDVIIIQVCKGI